MSRQSVKQLIGAILILSAVVVYAADRIVLQLWYITASRFGVNDAGLWCGEGFNVALSIVLALCGLVLLVFNSDLVRKLRRDASD